jgi:hypothetical protein
MNYDPRLSHFDIDMPRGRQGELFVSDIQAAFSEGRARIEVKTDYKYFDYNRLYVEQECRGRDGIWRPSGINITKSGLWAFVLGGFPGMFIFETAWVRRALDDALSLSPKNAVSCDYGENPTRGVVITLNHFARTRK